MSNFNGSAGDDIFTGGVDADTAVGNGGNDSLSGSAGGDALVGGTGADTLDGGSGGDILISAETPLPYTAYYPDITARLDRGAEVDKLSGGDGDDIAYAGYGDSIDGGAGTDTLYISLRGAPSGVIADFSQAALTLGGGLISGIERADYVEGSNYGDRLSGGINGYGTITGGSGDDTLTAGSYTLVLSGDTGNDVLDGRNSQNTTERVDGGDGNDTINGPDSSYNTSVYGGAGDDVISAYGLTHGDAGNDTITMQATANVRQVYGDSGDDHITAAPGGSGTYYYGYGIAGGAGADTLDGSGGGDFLYTADFASGSSLPADDMGLEHDKISAGGGDDTLSAGLGDSVDGGAGNDVLRYSLAGLATGATFSSGWINPSQPITINGGLVQNVEHLIYLLGTDYADTLYIPTQSVRMTVDAGDGDDDIVSEGSSITLSGGSGDDVFYSGAAGDIFDGGSGRDAVDYVNSTTGVYVNLATGEGAGGDSLVSVEIVYATDFNDTVSGDGGDNVLAGYGGVDTLTYASAIAGVWVGLSATYGTVSAGTDTNFGFENLVGSSFNDTLSGDGGSNVLDGGAGVDTLSYATATAGVWMNLSVTGAQYTSGAGSDTVLNFENLTGSGFDDALAGNARANVLNGGAGTDTVSYIGATSGVTVSLALQGQAQATGGAGSDTLSNFENLTGSEYNDTLTGNAANNVIDGYAGSDTVFGGAGDDTIADTMGSNYLRGEDGNDVMSGGGEFDDIQGNMGNDTEHGGGSRDWVVGGKDNDLLFGDDGDDVINGNLGSDTCEGGNGADTVRGGQGDDVVRGQAGNDWLSGDLGDDTITGGAGADTFHAFAGVGIDRITDFNRAEGDRILLDAGTTYAVSQSGADTVVDITGGGQIVLVGVQVSSPTAGWITVG